MKGTLNFSTLSKNSTRESNFISQAAISSLCGAVTSLGLAFNF